MWLDKICLKKILFLCVVASVILTGCVDVKKNIDVSENKIEEKKDNKGIENNKNVENVVEEEIKKYPLVYGSASLMPLMAKLRSSYTGEDIKKVEQNIIKYNSTQVAWSHIEYNQEYAAADMILVYELSGNVDSREYGLDDIYEYVEIANDALAFVVNDENEVSDINDENIKNIYKEKITNWKELGGDDMDIMYFRNENGDASEIMFKNNILNTYPNVIYAVDKDNEGYIQYSKAIFDNEVNSIGYATYNYLENMMQYKNHNMKILSVNGVIPCYDTIKNKTYPYIGKIYAVIKKNEPKDSDARKLFEYIQSDAAKKIIRDCGLVEVNE